MKFFRKIGGGEFVMIVKKENKMIKFTFKTYIMGLIIAIYHNELKDWIDIAIKKLCPICKTKMNKNALNTYNCPRCFSDYFERKYNV